MALPVGPHHPAPQQPHIFRAGGAPCVMETVWRISAEQKADDLEFTRKMEAVSPTLAEGVLGLPKKQLHCWRRCPGAFWRLWLSWGVYGGSCPPSWQHPSWCSIHMWRSNSLTRSDQRSQNRNTSHIIHMENQTCFFL